MLRIACVVALLASSILCCTIAGNDIGFCASRLSIEDDLDFCKNNVPERVCVPIWSVQSILCQSVWPKYTVKHRDCQTEHIFFENIENQLVS